MKTMWERLETNVETEIKADYVEIVAEQKASHEDELTKMDSV
jgi:hypothetical protein